ncbi:MAG: InlB B-repeat-containing protein [Christensenellales bacterium]
MISYTHFQHQLNSYNISYAVNGGDALGTIQYNLTKTLVVPTRSHYTFDGWYIGNTQITNSNGKMLKGWSITNDNAVLTAKWNAVFIL